MTGEEGEIGNTQGKAQTILCHDLSAAGWVTGGRRQGGNLSKVVRFMGKCGPHSVGVGSLDEDRREGILRQGASCAMISALQEEEEKGRRCRKKVGRKSTLRRIQGGLRGEHSAHTG